MQNNFSTITKEQKYIIFFVFSVFLLSYFGFNYIDRYGMSFQFSKLILSAIVISHILSAAFISSFWRYGERSNTVADWHKKIIISCASILVLLITLAIMKKNFCGNLDIILSFTFISAYGLSLLAIIRQTMVKRLCAACNKDLYQFLELAEIIKQEINYCPLCGNKTNLSPIYPKKEKNILADKPK